jgi:hypothetical protein
MIQNNKTLFGEWSDLKRGGVMTWGMTFLMLSLAGNTIILILSRCKAIKHSKVTVTLIEHIAGSDLGVTLVGILPDVVTKFAFDWQKAPWLCLARFVGHGMFVSSSTYLVCALNVCKLLSLLFPLRSRLWTKRFANALAVTIWVFSIVTSGAILAVAMLFNEMILDHRTNMCMYKVTTPPMALVGITQTTLQWTIPDIVVMVSSVWILIIARHKARKLRRWRWQSVAPVLMIAAVFCISYLPLTCMFTVLNFVLVKGKAVIETVNETKETVYVYVEYDRAGQPMSGFLYSELYLLLCMLTYLNSVANIFIYTVSMASFNDGMRRILGKKVLGWHIATRNSVSAISDGSFIQTNNSVSSGVAKIIY